MDSRTPLTPRSVARWSASAPSGLGPLSAHGHRTDATGAALEQILAIICTIEVMRSRSRQGRILTTPNTDGIGRLLHDLREPIGAFIIYLSLLENEELSADGRRHLEAMVRNARRMGKMIGDIAEALGLEGDGSDPHPILVENRRT